MKINFDDVPDLPLSRLEEAELKSISELYHDNPEVQALLGEISWLQADLAHAVTFGELPIRYQIPRKRASDGT